MRLNYSLLFIIIFIMLSGCDKLFFDDLSNITQKTFSDYEFKQVRIHDSFDVILKQDTVFKVKIEAPVEFIENIKCYVNGDTLEVEDSNLKNRLPSYKTPSIVISFPEIEYFRMRAPGEIETDGVIKQNTFKLLSIRHIGTFRMAFDVGYLQVVTGLNRSASKYIISGEAQRAYFWMRNSSKLNALELNTKNRTTIVNNSIRDSYVNVTNNNTFKVTLNAYGNVYYKGSPEEIIIEEQSSDGRLIQIE